MFNNNLIPFIFLLIFLLLISDKVLFALEKVWNEFNQEIYEPENQGSDSLENFIGLDENIIQVSTDIKTKFEDVAGNE